MTHDEELDNTIAWIEATLCNDEVSGDNEMLSYFMDNGIEKEAAILILRQRQEALTNLHFKLDTNGLNLEGIPEPNA
jgi:hypothetical protein